MSLLARPAPTAGFAAGIGRKLVRREMALAPGTFLARRLPLLGRGVLPAGFACALGRGVVSIGVRLRFRGHRVTSAEEAPHPRAECKDFPVPAGAGRVQPLCLLRALDTLAR